MYDITYSKIAQNFIKKLDKEDQKKIFSKLERIRIRPENFLIKLQHEQVYKLRIGDFRIFIDLKEKELVILVLNIGKRKNVYKKK